jgi:hypothetical protein
MGRPPSQKKQTKENTSLEVWSAFLVLLALSTLCATSLCLSWPQEIEAPAGSAGEDLGSRFCLEPGSGCWLLHP